MPIVDAYSDEQLRLLVNLAQHHDAWLGAERELDALPYGMRWRDSNGRSTLLEVVDRVNNTVSRGPRSATTEALFADYHARKSGAQAAREGARARLAEAARLYRALRLPMIPGEAASILREADRRGLLGTHLLAIGTNAVPAYCIEAAGRILGAPEETDGFDMAWVAVESATGIHPVWTMLKAVDPSYTVNLERPFQARNRRAFEFELLVAPSRAGALARRDQPRPVPLPEQEWLLHGRPVSHVVVARDGSPARLAVPDPRWFALQKLWLAVQEKRSPLKRGKDERQGFAILDAVAVAMPHYPLDAGFAAALPRELAPHFARWAARDIGAPARDW
ncbi:MAG: nucleotidyltransferase domain-containing protein [Acetobacteraceae bacterium]|nr:nucleotidyltransferase domain-containing protein [Acetobacteraceae bacterium]